MGHNDSEYDTCMWCQEIFHLWYCDDCDSRITDLCEHCHKEAHDKGY